MANTTDKHDAAWDRDTAWAQTLWRAYLTGDDSLLDNKVKTMRRIFKTLPHDPRCKVCNAPFAGIGGMLVSPFGWGSGRSSFNQNMCDRCEKLVKKYQVGIELPLTMLFADVRNSTALAEAIGPTAFHQLINRYYRTCTGVLSETNALINRLIGDALIALYVPGLAGPEHPKVAVDAARQLLEATGHTEPNGPWIGVGIGIHTATVYVGAVGSSERVSDITVLGDAANITARLSSQAADGEILVSGEACKAGHLDLQDCELCTLKLKGRNETVDVRVVRVAAGVGVES
jgi:adenylate cyclase